MKVTQGILQRDFMLDHFALGLQLFITWGADFSTKGNCFQFLHNDRPFCRCLNYECGRLHPNSWFHYPLFIIFCTIFVTHLQDLDCWLHQKKLTSLIHSLCPCFLTGFCYNLDCLLLCHKSNIFKGFHVNIWQEVQLEKVILGIL